MSPTREYELLWTDLGSALRGIFEHRQITTNRYMQLYSNIERYCALTKKPLQGPGSREDVKAKVYGPSVSEEYRVKTAFLNDFVAGNLYHRIALLLRAIVTQRAEEADQKSGEDLVNFYSQFWDRFQLSAKVTDSLCRCLDRQCYHPRQSDNAANEHFTYKLIMEVWRMIFHGRHHQRVIGEILKIIQRDRSGIPTNTRIIKNVVESLHILGEQPVPDDQTVKLVNIYKTKFEDAFIQETEIFYKADVHNFLSDSGYDVVQYTYKVNAIIAAEKRRVISYLHPSSLDRLMQSLQKILIREQLKALDTEFSQLFTNVCCGNLIAAQQIALLYDMVSLLKEDEAFNNMRANFRSQVAIRGNKDLQDRPDKKPEPFVNTIVEVYTEFLNFINTSLRKDTGFLDALGTACEDVVNRKAANNETTTVTRSRSAETLAKYCDNLLKKGNRSTLDLSADLDRAMVVFKFLEDKDAFNLHYRRFLCNRLVAKLSVSNDAELEMLSKLQVLYGLEFTNHMQRMCQDASKSSEENDAFVEWVAGNTHLIVEPITIGFSTMVLTSHSWPLAADKENELFILPRELVPSVQAFQLYYSTLHGGHKFNWVYSKSRVDIVSHCYKYTYSFKMYAYSCAILLLFNDAITYTVLQLLEATCLSDEVVIQIVQLFLKARLLLSNTKPEDITMDSRVFLNEAYENRTLKVNLCQTLRRETRQEQNGVQTSLEEGRKFQIQAAIARVMKARKEMGGRQLQEETKKLLITKFIPTEASIRYEIDQLTKGAEPILKLKEGATHVYQYIIGEA